MIRLQVYQEAIRRSENDDSLMALVFRNNVEYLHAATEFKSILPKYGVLQPDHNAAVYTCINQIYLIDGELNPFQLNGTINLTYIGHLWLIDLPREIEFDWQNAIRHSSYNAAKWTMIRYD